MDELETAIITKTGHGFEVTDNFGDILGSFKNWDQVEDMFRKRDFSEEYIAKRRADLNRNTTTKIDDRFLRQLPIGSQCAVVVGS